jgi:AcrR family transcriptional regulator
LYSVKADSQAFVDLHGRPLGARAVQKRGLILAATRVLLEERGLREIRVADIARAVDASPATFYQYFSDVEHVVLQLAAEVNSEIPALLELFDGMWRGKQGQRRAFEVVNFFIDYWDRHGPILRIRNLAAEEGDGRFMALRRDAMEPVLAAIEALMRRHAANSRNPLIEPASAALAMSAILDRLAAVHKIVEGERVSREDLVGTSAQILFRTLTGK